MKIRTLLAAATCLALPLAAHAQPVTGPYVSLGAGTSILYPVDASSAGLSGKALFKDDYAGVGGIGYGLGNGFRVELGGDFIRNTAHKFDSSAGGQAGVTGAEEKYGPMLNLLYDIPVGLPVVPYVGAGAGYQYVKFDHDISGAGVKVGGTEGSFAYDVIGGVSYPIDAVPGLSATAEYRFMQLTGSRKYAATVGSVDVGQESSHTFTLGLRYALFAAPMMAPAPTPAPVAAPAPQASRTYIVFFDWDKYNLTPRAVQIIAEAASDSKTTAMTKINVSGYTDTSGTPTYNQGLSVRRAKAVAIKLMADGVPAAEISIHAYGETHLLVPTGPGVREPQNRRVEIVLN